MFATRTTGAAAIAPAGVKVIGDDSYSAPLTLSVDDALGTVKGWTSIS